MRRLATVALAAILIGGPACGGGGGDGGGTGPSGPGEISLRITLPAGTADGVVLVRISGDVVSSVLPKGFQLRAVGVGGTTVHIIARGTLQGTTLLAALCIPRIEDEGRYTVELLQAAAGQAGGYAKRNLAGYVVELDRATIVARPQC